MLFTMSLLLGFLPLPILPLLVMPMLPLLIQLLACLPLLILLLGRLRKVPFHRLTESHWHWPGRLYPGDTS